MKTILAPIDFSRVTDAVVDEAAALAHAFQGRVVLLTITQPALMLSEYAPVADNVAEIAAAGEKNAARQLAQFEAKLAAHAISVESVQLTGMPTTLILEQAEKISADYIVMGSHGHTALYDLIVGSTTHGVLLRAQCPVIIVPTVKAKGLKTREERYAVV
ncbi:MAG TPA: universal stress protein [Opitutaceae bacterium]|nr:universal stress protein [Opitutaceae bacterium]